MSFSVSLAGKDCLLSEPVRADRFLRQEGHRLSEAVAVRINGRAVSLLTMINRSCRVEIIGKNDPEAVEIFRQTLCFLVPALVKEIFPDVCLTIQRSVTLGYAYRVRASVWDSSMTDRLCQRINEVREKCGAIRSRLFSYTEMKMLFESGHLDPQTWKLFRLTPSDEILLYEWNGYYGYLFHFPVTDAGLLPPVEVIFEPAGCVVRFCADPADGRPIAFEPNRTLIRVYQKGNRWGEISGVETVGDLNDCIRENRVGDFIRINETLQENALAEAAGQIAARGDAVKAVLLAGPSSSGKTTTLKRLCTQLEVLGYHPIPLSLDNYYRNRDEIPRDENGDYDFECLESIDVPLIRRQLSDFFDGKTVTPPVFDFVSGKSRRGKPLEARPDSIIVIEGIHGLNPQLLPQTAGERVFRIYLSALTQIRIDSANRIATTDNRLLRRLVRDARYRSTPAERTFAMWPKVIDGERKYIFPFQNEADTAFNSSLDYEISVLKVYAEPLLRSIQPDSPHFETASHLLKLLSLFLSIPEQDVPPYSLLREFIGNSGFSY